ncbi:hypothetical protein [Variovorax gossypii]|uniref:hypothetical protein n=1 Tax=uncultured Variovorax sp. TaxID=114708 RepID=UPI002612764C|nr:hypothetical protein [uncultured Variovorax sp.]
MEYRLNCGQYVLHKADGRTGELVPVGRVMDEIALGIDVEDGTLHKHGPVDRVNEWHVLTSKQLRVGGATELADHLVVVSGRFPLEEVNKCLTHTGYAKVFHDKLVGGEIEPLAWDYEPPTPCAPGMG